MAVLEQRRDPRFEYLCDDDPLPRRRTGVARYGWRILAANNRPLGRAVAVTDSLEDCIDAATALHGAADRLELPVSLDTTSGTWMWRALLDRHPVAVGAHAYARRIECARSLTQFLDAVARADPANGVVRYFGPRSLIAFPAARGDVVQPRGAALSAGPAEPDGDPAT